MSGYVLKKLTLGSPGDLLREAFSKNEKPDIITNLHKEYLGINQSPDALFLRACAVEAFELSQIVLGVRNLVLTEFGVTFKGEDRMEFDAMVFQTWDGGYPDYSEETAAPYVERNDKKVLEATEEARNGVIGILAEANTEFLFTWETLCKDRKKNRELAKKGDKGVIAELEEQVNSKPGILITPIAVVDLLEEDGFIIKNPEELTKPPAEAIEKGVIIEAHNEAGETRTVILSPDGTMTTEVEVPGAAHSVCQKTSERFSEDVTRRVQSLAMTFGTSAKLATLKKGKGRAADSVSRPKTAERVRQLPAQGRPATKRLDAKSRR
jgi:hypothetical protein